IVSRAIRPCSMVGREAGLELRDAGALVRVDEARGILPRQGAGREQVDGLADRDDARGGTIGERYGGVAGRDALAELQFEESRENAVAGHAAEGPPAAAAVGTFLDGRRTVVKEGVGLPLQLELRDGTLGPRRVGLLAREDAAHRLTE